jgi:hypothetical protein
MKEQIKKILSQAIMADIVDSRIGIEPYANQIAALCEARCQARVERLIERVEKDIFWIENTGHSIGINPPSNKAYLKWQAIKKEYNV